MKKKTLNSKSPSLKDRVVDQYRDKDKQVRTSARAYKRQYVEKHVIEAEVAAQRNDMRTVYQITRKLRGDRGENQNHTVESKDGSTITEEKTKLDRWREHFQQLLNQCDPPTLAYISEAEQDMDIELLPITIPDVKEAIKKLKNGKALGGDNVYAKMLKSEEHKMPQLRQHILLDVRDNVVISGAWKKGTIIKLPKKGKQSEGEERHHTTVHHQQGFLSQQSPTHLNSSGETTTPRTSRLQDRKITHRPHLSPPPDP